VLWVHIKYITPFMATMIKQSLSQKQLQKLSPQQIQLMKLLQIPTAALEQRIKEELETNPALEEGAEEGEFETDEIIDNSEDPEERERDKDESEERDQDAEEIEFEHDADNFELDDYMDTYAEEDPSVYAPSQQTQQEEQRQIPYAVQNSFHEYLEKQLGLLSIKDEEQLLIAKQIIGSIDDDGYLRRDPLSIIDDLMFSNGIIVSEEDILAMLTEIQKLDPVGIGARDLRECLLIQLKQKIVNKEKKNLPVSDELRRATVLIEEFFEEFSKKHYHKLVRHLDISEEDLKKAVDEILKLNPKPASGYSGDKNENNAYIIPDYSIVNRDGELELSLNNRNAPELRVNDYYQEMLKAYSRPRDDGKKMNQAEKDALMFIRQKIDSARWFIDAIVKRQNTMYKTMYAIMQFQYEYFLTGDDRKLKPMILKDISDITGLDISTVSRVANSKFVQTEFGTKRIKEFFSESLQNQDGEEVSTLEVKQILTDIINGEDKSSPYSDEDLKELLKDKGYNIARRTVAKYREQLNVPVARLRKEL